MGSCTVSFLWHFSIIFSTQWRSSRFTLSKLVQLAELFLLLPSGQCVALLWMNLLDCGLCCRSCFGRTLPAAMPFGCLTLGEKKDYNNPSEVTDKYDLGQIVKSWVRTDWRQTKKEMFVVSLTGKSVLSSGRNSARYSGRRTGTLWECTPVKSSIRRTGGKWGKPPRTRLWF